MMEEQILGIIQKNAAGSTEYITDGLYHKIAVREIAVHFREFIEWIIQKAQRLELAIDSSFILIFNGRYYTLKELHQYYCDNVLNLKQK